MLVSVWPPGVPESSSISHRGRSAPRPPSCSSVTYHWTSSLLYFDFSSLCFRRLFCNTPKPHPLLFCFFCSSIFFLCLDVVTVVVYVRGCACVRSFMCVCACVFFPAASIDYGSFADRCTTWLELLRLKAHTIRRGSVKTSRTTHSLAHSGDHTLQLQNTHFSSRII